MLSGGAADASSGSDFVQFDGEMPQDRGFEGDAVAGGDLCAALVDVAAGRGDHADVVVRVDPPRDRQAQGSG